AAGPFAAAVQVAGYEDALRSWREGKKEEALATFMAVDFTRRPLFPKGSPLGYSERDYVALPRAVNDKLQPQIIEETKRMKGLAVSVKEAATRASQRGDVPQAERYLKQLKQCGEALAHPDSLALLQMVGKAFTRLATNPPSSSPAPSPR
ncbi:MAG: hypothetical protein JNK85_12050, partial [Verrucomicrobiales bacterium]|nr:hypothetical protein [Verrucomicrobiales bacterium]